MIKDAKLYSRIDLQTKVDSASPAKLIQLLYENTLLQLQKSRKALEQETSDGAQQDKSAQTAHINEQYNAHIVKAIDSIMALREALDFEVASELPHNLDNLYDYLQRRLLKARLLQDPAAIDECIALTETLKSGWDTLCN